LADTELSFSQKRTVAALTKAGEANKEAGAARQKAGEADERSKKIERANLVLQSDILKLRKEAGARRLTGKQKETLRKSLEGSRVPIAVGWNPRHNEAGDFARDFISVLSDAHWTPTPVLSAFSKYGVSLGAVEADFKDLPEVKQLRAALLGIGIQNDFIPLVKGSTSMNPPVELHVLYMLIGPHPPLSSTSGGN